LRLQLEQGLPDGVGSNGGKESVGIISELSARLAAVEEQAEALSKQLDGSADVAAVATAAPSGAQTHRPCGGPWTHWNPAPGRGIVRQPRAD